MPASKKAGTGQPQIMTSAQIRQSYLDFFEARGHTIVPSMSLVPGGDQTLLFTNSGMVQFKDVFLGTGSRPYVRVADSQKCMRVAGKHNDLDDVGRDDTHHTFFEMLGNWSFGDYYKKEAIDWAWSLLTDVWGLPADQLWATCFEDELGEIERDDEAAEIWRQQPGFDPSHLLFFGREENFWEMADTGPCGPDSEIFIDRGKEYCERREEPGHECRVNGNCQRFLELWNLVFIQYNRKSERLLNPLPAKHVDTGMGFERLVSVLQNVPSNYRTDLFTPMLNEVQRLTGHDAQEREQNLTPYRVIADHARAAAFLIADGVVPGNIGRNYICRMIIRRASRFGSMIGLHEPFLARVADVVIQEYGGFYHELKQNRSAIEQTLTEEEERFQRTVDNGLAHLENIMNALKARGDSTVPGDSAFDLYATYGLPFEITRDIARERDLDVDESGFTTAMEAHRSASTGSDGLGMAEAEDIEAFSSLLEELRQQAQLGAGGVLNKPYEMDEIETRVLAMLREGHPTEQAAPGENISIVLNESPFYLEAGGQVADSGIIHSTNWTIQVTGTSNPVEGLILHEGTVEQGKPAVGDLATAVVDRERRLDIMRNHTATHLLHAALRNILGDHVRQAGSLVAPDRLRFDFTHSSAMTPQEIEQVENWVNQAILTNHPLSIELQKREDAISAGAMALFGETYGSEVRTVQIGHDQLVSYELCGGTHVHETSVIGSFLILHEGSVASGIRRIEATTGREALASIQSQLKSLNQAARSLGVQRNAVPERVEQVLEEVAQLHRELRLQRKATAADSYSELVPIEIDGAHILHGQIPDADADTLRELADRFRAEYKPGAAVLASVVDGKPIIIAAVSDELIKRAIHAGELVKHIAAQVGGGGGGKPSLAQAGGNDPSALPQALASVPGWIGERLKPR